MIFSKVFGISLLLAVHRISGQQQQFQPPPQQVPQQQVPQQPQQQVPQQNFQQVPQQNFQQVPQQNFQQVPQQNFQQVPQQNFQQVPQQNFQQVPQQNYQQVPPQQVHQQNSQQQVHQQNSQQQVPQNPPPPHQVPQQNFQHIPHQPDLQQGQQQPTPDLFVQPTAEASRANVEPHEQQLTREQLEHQRLRMESLRQQHEQLQRHTVNMQPEDESNMYGVKRPTGHVPPGFDQEHRAPGVPPLPLHQEKKIKGRIPPVQHQPTSRVALEPEYDILAPGMAMDYRIWVEAAREECFYQFVQKGAQIFVSFYVLRGGDHKAGFAVRDPQGVLVLPYQWKERTEYEATEPEGGYYSVCVDNQFSRSEGKLVNIYITSFMYDEWDKHTEEVAQLDIAAQNFTDTLGLIDHKLEIARQYTSFSRSLIASDWQLLSAIKRRVTLYSLLQCTTVCLASLLQVFFVRRLFSTGTARK